MVKMTDDILFHSCAAIFGNQSAVDALYDFGADVFIGDAVTRCSWIMSDILGCAEARCLPTPAVMCGHHSPALTAGKLGRDPGCPCLCVVSRSTCCVGGPNGLQPDAFAWQPGSPGVWRLQCCGPTAMLPQNVPCSAPCRLPRIDYNSGAGDAAVEAALYFLSMPSLTYTPVFTSGLPPTGKCGFSRSRFRGHFPVQRLLRQQQAQVPAIVVGETQTPALGLQACSRLPAGRLLCRRPRSAAAVLPPKIISKSTTLRLIECCAQA